ncbi:Protein of unknown function, partial [Gryllus bimaculatus]
MPDEEKAEKEVRSDCENARESDASTVVQEEVKDASKVEQSSVVVDEEVAVEAKTENVVETENVAESDSKKEVISESEEQVESDSKDEVVSDSRVEVISDSKSQANFESDVVSASKENGDPVHVTPETADDLDNESATKVVGELQEQTAAKPELAQASEVATENETVVEEETSIIPKSETKNLIEEDENIVPDATDLPICDAVKESETATKVQEMSEQPGVTDSVPESEPKSGPSVLPETETKEFDQITTTVIDVSTPHAEEQNEEANPSLANELEQNVPMEEPRAVPSEQQNESAEKVEENGVEPAPKI